MAGGIRLDPLSTIPRESDKKRTRVSASYLRGFRLLPRGIFPAARMSNTGNQSIPTGSETKITFNTRDYDSPYEDVFQDTGRAMVDLTAEEIVIRFAGLYTIRAFALWAADADGTIRQIRFVVNGTGSSRENKTPLAGIWPTATLAVLSQKFSPGDQIDVRAFHDKGSDLNILGANDGIWMSATWGAL